MRIKSDRFIRSPALLGQVDLLVYFSLSTMVQILLYVFSTNRKLKYEIQEWLRKLFILFVSLLFQYFQAESKTNCFDTGFETKIIDSVKCIVSYAFPISICTIPWNGILEYWRSKAWANLWLNWTENYVFLIWILKLNYF